MRIDARESQRSEGSHRQSTRAFARGFDMPIISALRDFTMKTRRIATTLLCAAAILVLCACTLTNIQEPNHIVLLAPFEGLYRRSGYNALAAMQSITDTTDAPTHPNTQTPITWTPTALDTSRDPSRASEKALAPDNAAAVVGPLLPAEAAQVFSILHKSSVDWYAPFATTENGFIPPNEPAWLEALIKGIASSARTYSEQNRILIAGWDAFSTITPVAEIATSASAPVLLIADASESAAEVQPGDLLVWLGDAAEGVRFIAEVRAEHPDVAVWLPYWAAGDVFIEHASALDGWSFDGIEWGGWVPADVDAVTPAAAESALITAATAIAMGASQPEMSFVSGPLARGASPEP